MHYPIKGLAVVHYAWHPVHQVYKSEHFMAHWQASYKQILVISNFRLGPPR